MTHIGEYLNPVGAMIELTSRCNLNCSHCYNASRSESNDLSSNEWKNIIQQLCEMRIGTILFTGGEPLMAGDLLIELLGVINHYRNTRVYINTNGYLITQELMNLLVNASNVIIIQVSIDGAYPEIHDEVRGVSGSWFKAVEACMMVQSAGIGLRIAHTLNRLNRDSMEDMIELAVFLGASILGMGPAVPLGRGKIDRNKIIMDIHERVASVRKVEDYKKKYARYIDIKRTSEGGIQYYKNYLKFNQDWLIINSEGFVKIENRLPYVVGSVKNESITSLWSRVNIAKRSGRVMCDVMNCINTGEEMDSQQLIYLF